MNKIPFNIKFRPQIESGEYKVETRDGRPVRIACWDRQHKEFPLIVLISCEGGEDCEIYTIDGKFYRNRELPAYDLIIITPEPELTEFEQAFGEELFNEPFDEDAVEEIKAKSAKLLSLARNEIVKSGYAIIEGEHYLDEGRKNYERGKAEALKDLPRWRKCAPCDKDEATIPAWIVRFDAELAGESAVVHNGHYILFGDLEKLPKEE